MSAPRRSMGDQLRAAVETAFAGQAEAYGADLHRRAVEIRARDPLATFLMDTFRKQVRRFGERAMSARAAGDRGAALEWAGATVRAETNLRRVEAAVEGADFAEAAE